MIQTKITDSHTGKKVALRGFGFGRYQHFKLGQVGLNSVKRRLHKGLGENDTPMPKLGKDKKVKVYYVNTNGERTFYTKRVRGYESEKRRKGGRPIRDLFLTGDMLANLTVRWASDTQVTVALTSRKQRIKALANQRRARWLTWSPNDQKVIIKEAERLFKHEVTAVSQVLVQGGRYKKRRPTSFTRNTGTFARRAA